ncbi:MAG: putative pre-16S rRNA nuclease [Turneriella sp.]|nr:putative pre-16S rRNA nuclease [Turneriella sp.]
MQSEKTERLLCIDYGRKFIGLAVGNFPGITARALSTLDATKSALFLTLEKILKEEQVNRILLGFPFSEVEGEIHHEIREFEKKLVSAFALPVTLVDESYSSQEADALLAQTQLGRKKKVRAQDSEAAKLVLLRYLGQ